jgi:pimeloyl-ACP methyl ester carboxylesterase
LTGREVTPVLRVLVQPNDFRFATSLGRSESPTLGARAACASRRTRLVALLLAERRRAGREPPARSISPLISDADAFFTKELPALRQWSFTEADARQVTRPVLAVVGEYSAPTFPERRELLLSWLPNLEPFELPGPTHLLHLQNAEGMAEALASLFARVPLARSAGPPR